MTFSDVVGQADVKRHLLEMVNHNRLSHALLFSGKGGRGGLPLAIALARYVVCERTAGQAQEGGLFESVAEPAPVLSDACGVCSACKKAAGLVHPDIHFSYPVIPKKAGDKPLSTDFITEWREFVKTYPYGNTYDWLQFIGAENKQGNITAHECADIIRKLSLKSFESAYKILIMWMPEYLGTEGNKLLKLIEEPPAGTLFILVTENESLLLPTVVSRTQSVRIPPLSPADIQQELIKKGLPPDQAMQVAATSEGSYRESLQLMQHAGEDWQSYLREWLNTVVRSNLGAQVRWVEEMSGLGREKQKQFLRYFSHLLGLAVRLSIMEEVSVPNETERDFARRLNKMIGFEQQEAIMHELDNATYYIERNANPKMLFHALTIKLYHIIADKSLILTTGRAR